MAPRRVIPALDVAEDGHSGLGLRGEPPACQQFALERCEEALAHGVVVSVADRSHGGAGAAAAAATTERQGRILGGFKRSLQLGLGLCWPIVAIGQAPLRVFSKPVSFE